MEEELAGLAANEAKLKVAYNDRVLSEELRGGQAPPLRIFQRALDLMLSLHDSCERQLFLRSARGREARELEEQRTRVRRLGEQLSVVLREQRLEELDALAKSSLRLLDEVREFSRRCGAEAGDLQAVRRDIDKRIGEVLAAAEELKSQQEYGLPDVEIPVDDAMLTAIHRRYDLTNEREQLADAWRQIKLRGDALRSNLTIRGSHEIRTPLGKDSAFGFTLDDSSTQVGITFDAPLNRLTERNAFRLALIDYNRQWRNVMQLEDQIKLSIRRTLRALNLDREQYQIAVASAALAYERVVSTRLQLQQAAKNVTARDFLEAQQAYTTSLNTVARARIDYLVDRIDLFLALEQLEVDELGFWPQVYDEQYAPTPRLDMPLYCGLPWGELASGVRYSQDMLRMLQW